MEHKKLLVSLTVLSVFAGAFFILRSQPNKVQTITSPLSLLSKQNKTEVPTPTPILFQEMTVPYLRSREYKSTLGPLDVESNNGTYTSYLTSYTADGLKINGLLTKPTGEQPAGGWPAIIFIHGYIPPTLYRTTGQSYSSYVDYLAKNGFVVFKIDLRGHDRSEGKPGGAYYSSDYIIDALSAYTALQQSDFVNPNKIGMWGHSMAGNVVIRSIVSKPDIPAAVIWAGAGFTYEDLRKYGIDDNSYRPPSNDTDRQQRRRLLFDTYGQYSSDNPFWKQVSPLFYINDLKGAIALHHAVDDDVVNVGYSRDLAAFLKNTSIPHEINEYPSGGHNISGTSFNTAMRRTVEFYKKYLGE